MLTPIPGQVLPSNGSKKKIYFDCSCGRKNVPIKWNYYIRGHSKTCGKCGLKSISYWERTKFGKLIMKEPYELSIMSNKKMIWLCDCGRETLPLKINRVTGGNTNSCGRCNEIQITINQKFGKLKTLESIIILPTSRHKIKCKCDCGKETNVLVMNLTRGLSKSCGKCNVMTAEYLSTHKFGKVRVKELKDLHKGSAKIIDCMCDCGNEFKTKFYYLTSGDTKSCGRCNLITAEETKTKKFGRLRLKTPQNLMISSHTQADWICDCGNEKAIFIANVLRGRSISCGNCREHIANWFLNNKNRIQKLKTPIQQSNIPEGPFQILEIIKYHDKPFKAICPACQQTYYPRWGNFRTGRALTCGCVTNQTSMPQREICNFIKSLGIGAVLEYKIEGLKYDIFISSRKLLIEYQGLKWHAFQDSKQKDFHKYKLAISSGYDFLSIFEDEWRKDENKVKNLIKNRLQFNNPKPVRPTECEIKKIFSATADIFYEEHHYIGKCRAKVHYGAYFDNQLIACCSFSIPTRQSKHPWELIRMASHPNFRIHGIWSKILKLFIREYTPSSIVSFSDNRLFIGRVYSKMGFTKDGELKPDYYWVKHNKRYHKSGLRKTKEEKNTGLTETKLRQSQGYTKVWDLGKKRWTMYF